MIGCRRSNFLCSKRLQLCPGLHHFFLFEILEGVKDRINIQAVGRTPWYTRTQFVGLDFRPGDMICQSGPKETPGKLPHMIMLVPHSIFSSQEVMELQKDAMRGEEVGLSPCASGSARFCHMFVPTILEMGGLQILCNPGADRQWKYRGAVPARGKPCQR